MSNAKVRARRRRRTRAAKSKIRAEVMACLAKVDPKLIERLANFGYPGGMAHKVLQSWYTTTEGAPRGHHFVVLGVDT